MIVVSFFVVAKMQWEIFWAVAIFFGLREDVWIQSLFGFKLVLIECRTQIHLHFIERIK